MHWKAALLTLALPAYAALHESASLPHGWKKSRVALSDDAFIHLQVALNYQNLDTLESKLLDVSDPTSANYGKYLEKEQVDALFAPSTDSLEKVTSWLKDAGAVQIKSDGSIVHFAARVKDANKLLDTKFGLFTNGEINKLGALQYSVPDELSDVIDLVAPTTYFGSTKAHRKVPRAPPVVRADLSAGLEARQLKSSCEQTITIPVDGKPEKFTVLTPTCLKQLYYIDNYKPDPSSGSTIAFGNFLNQSASYSDLALYEKHFKIPSQNFTVTALINGATNDQNPATEMDDEANLDVQNIVGLVGGLPISAYITGGLPPFVPDLLTPNKSAEQNEPYLPYYQYLLSQPNSKLPYVITNSYGDHENTVPEKYAKRVCNMIGMMGMRGRTILESSGDEGTGAVCLSNKPPPAKNHPEFTPQFPGTCPYVTAVGGTQDANPERAWTGSSGGFSFYFSQPGYQKSAVETYLSKYISSSTKEYYSSNDYVDFSGRGFPDISAHSLTPDFYVVQNGSAVPSGGTSAASPVVASVMALLNDARFRAGLPSLGFANPWLYSKAFPAKTLTDITGGGSTGCAGINLQTGEKLKGAGIIPYASWNATVGWDPVTGLGTPNFQKLKALATS